MRSTGLLSWDEYKLSFKAIKLGSASKYFAPAMLRYLITTCTSKELDSSFNNVLNGCVLCGMELYIRQN